MYATDLSDLLRCRNDPSIEANFSNWWGDDEILSSVNEVHLYKYPMMALSFNENIGHALFDHLLAYVQHWFLFRKKGFPFKRVASYSVENCLSYDTSWYCEILRGMDAFGGASEVSLLPKNTPSDVLRCYETLHTPWLAFPRVNDYSPESMPTKEAFDEFRRVLFKKFELPREKDYRSLHPQYYNNGTPPPKILFYAHEPSGRRMWTNMNKLIANARAENKYKDVGLDIIKDFGALSAKEQAAFFNLYDVLIMVHGAQMANSIFTVDGTLIIEIGCAIPDFLGTPTFLSLIGAQYEKVLDCENNQTVCLECDDDPVMGNFNMSKSSFDAMLESVMYPNKP
jgi:hypothetical protein